MAETVLSLALKDVTLTITDGTRSYTPTFRGGTLSWTVATPELVETTDQNGNAISFRQGARTGRSEVTLTDTVIFHPGEHATDVTIMDFVTQTGLVASTWTTVSGTGVASRVIPAVESSERKRFKLTATIADRNGTSIKGGVYTWDDVDVVPGSTPTFEHGGARFPSLVFRSSQEQPHFVPAT